MFSRQRSKEISSMSLLESFFSHCAENEAPPRPVLPAATWGGDVGEKRRISPLRKWTGQPCAKDWGGAGRTRKEAANAAIAGIRGEEVCAHREVFGGGIE
jgi:hypothetical protein